MDPRVALGAVLLLVQAVQLVPMLRKVARDQRATGIAVPGEAAWAAAGIGWCALGIATSSPALAVSGALATAGSGTVTVVLCARDRALRTPATIGAVGTATALALAASVGGGDGLSIGLGVFGVVQFLPQLRETRRVSARRAVATAVSVEGAALRGLYTAGWAGYGVLPAPGAEAGDVSIALIAWGAAGFVTYSYQAIVTWRLRPDRPAPGSPRGRRPRPRPAARRRG